MYNSIDQFRRLKPEDIKNKIAYFKKAIIMLIVFIFLSSAVGTIGAGERGVLLQFGAVQDNVLEEGLYFKIPFAQKVIKMDVKVQKDQVSATAASKDLQMVSSDIALNYHLIPSEVNSVWQEVGRDYNLRVISPAIQEAVKATTAKFTAEELITRREEVKEDIKLNLTNRLITRGIFVDDFNIINFDFSSSFNEAIEQKVTAEQLKLKAERDLERIEIEKAQMIMTAQGKAEAIRIEANALTQNPQVIQLRWIEKWNGLVPTYWGEATPFIGLK